MRTKAVLFDLDGTLLDTSEGIFHTANYTVAMLGHEPCGDLVQLRKFVGPPLKDCFRIVYGFQDEKLLDECVRVYRKEYEKLGMHLCHIYPGLVETIDSLHSLGLKVGVCTLKYERLARMIFDEKGLSSKLDTVRGTDEEGKITKAESILRATKDLGLEPADVLMVGDTVNDQMGAQEAGVDFLAVSWGFGFAKGDEVAYGRLIDSPDQILSYVKEA